MKSYKIEISTATIVKAIAIILGLWLAYYILDVLLMLFIVVLLAMALEPGVTRITNWGVPRSISILIVFILLIAAFGLAVYIIVPPLVVQVRELANNAPVYIDKVTNFSASYSAKATQQILDTVSNSLGKLTGGFLGATIALFGGIVSVLTVMTLTFYLLLEEKGLRKALMNLVPLKGREKVAEMGQRIGAKIGLWISGQVTIMIIVGFMIGLAMWVVGAPYALALGVIAGILELIPVIGPVISGAVAVGIAFAAGAPYWLLIVIVAIYVVVQQLENQILVPKIMQKAIGVSPIVVIIAIIIGGKLLGVSGAVLAIPLVGIVSVLSQEYLKLANRNGA